MKLSKLIMSILAVCMLFSCSGPCEEGYEGVDCETEVRSAFLGRWSTDTFNCDGTLFYSEYIIRPSDISVLHIEIENKIEGGKYLGVIDDNGFTIPEQMVSVFKLFGEGSLTGDVLSLTIHVGGGPCFGELTK